MSLFVLIPGAGGAAWYWHRVVSELRAHGHEAVAVDLPGATGWDPARVAAAQAGGYPAEFDLATYFLHDVPAEVAAAGEAHAFAEADIAFGQPCAIERWPDVPTRVIAGRDDRFFPLEFQRRVAQERLGTDVDEVPGGHLAALSRPAELTGQLIQYVP